MRFPFHKMHGCGNDFLIIDYLGAHAPEFFPEEITYLCDRHYGLGADGLVVLYEEKDVHAALAAGMKGVLFPDNNFLPSFT